MIAAIETGRDRSAKEWLFIPALVLLGVTLLARRGAATKTGTPPAGEA